MVSLNVEVKEVQPSKLEGVLIATAEGEGKVVTFDMIQDLYTLKVGDRVSIVVSEEKPSDIDSYEFCGHGYLAADESKGYTLLSLWGIIFKFTPPLGLKADTKYYLCIKKAASS